MRNNARDGPSEIKGGLIRGGKAREKEITGGGIVDSKCRHATAECSGGGGTEGTRMTVNVIDDGKVQVSNHFKISDFEEQTKDGKSWRPQGVDR